MLPSCAPAIVVQRVLRSPAGIGTYSTFAPVAFSKAGITVVGMYRSCPLWAMTLIVRPANCWAAGVGDGTAVGAAAVAGAAVGEAAPDGVQAARNAALALKAA